MVVVVKTVSFRMAGIALAMVLLIGMTLFSTRPAMADVGDGTLNCSVGEICLKKHDDGNYENDLRHFWYNDLNHDNDNWSGPQGGVVGEAASMYWNRDTACDVYVLDYKPLVGLFQWLQMYQNGSSWYFQASDYGWNDMNDGHRRCAPE
ncbi:hypothetical protein AB0J90_28625 [Micromonospora sp. NPDC049523]|uniref:hypothetical protein n=1 Tax=Micromonospora sp. NPDC049523 TaxID=3155921 RepID=UPI00343AFF60